MKIIAKIKEEGNLPEFHLQISVNDYNSAKNEIKLALDRELNAYNRAVERILRLKEAVKRDDFKLHTV